MNRLKIVEQMIICCYPDVYKLHEDAHNEQLIKCLSTLEKKNLIIKKELVEKKNRNFARKISSTTAKSFYKIE